MIKSLVAPVSRETLLSLRAGDEILLSGVIYTARDVAHKRLCELIAKGEKLPLDLKDQIIYFTGPTPPRPHLGVGSAGPTTSGRMDAFSPTLIEKAHLAGMIGKGNRSSDVIQSMTKCGAVYFAAVGGAGALIAQKIVSSEVVCYEDLGPEAIHKLVVKDLPLIVAIDSCGNNLYVDGPKLYKL